jgi:hypothetical protein
MQTSGKLMRIMNDSRDFHCQVSMLKNTTHTNHVVDQFSSSSSKKQTEQKKTHECSSAYAMNRLVPTTLFHATSSANSNSSADDLRTRTGDDARHKTEQKQHFLRAKRARRERKLIRQRRVPD